MAKPKTKLPKVWVSVDDVGVEWCSIRKPSAEDRALIGPVHQYAPVQPPRRCVWTPCMSNESDASYKDTGCGDHLSGVSERFKFCPYCGGKITVRRKS